MNPAVEVFGVLVIQKVGPSLTVLG